MDILIPAIGGVAIVALAVWGVRAIIAVGKEPINYARNNLPHLINQSSSDKQVDDSMGEGVFHSGPAGYSPNTAYPDTQYGSGFDDEAEWNR